MSIGKIQFVKTRATIWK